MKFPPEISTLPAGSIASALASPMAVLAAAPEVAVTLPFPVPAAVVIKYPGPSDPSGFTVNCTGTETVLLKVCGAEMVMVEVYVPGSSPDVVIVIELASGVVPEVAPS